MVAHCQQNEVGFFGGPSLTRLRSNTVFRNADPLTGYQFGTTCTHWFKNGFGLQGQLTYALLGCTLPYIATDQLGNELFRDEFVYRFGHLGLSLGATYRTPGRLHGVASIGLMPTTIVVGEFDAPDDLRPGQRSVLDLTAKVNSPVLFGYGALGGAIDLKAPITIGLLVRYDHGLTTLSGPDFFENENIIETSWSVMLSISYRWPQIYPRTNG
jgi:hypothetical protein